MQAKIIDRELLAALSSQAAASARGRKNHNFHHGDDSLAHRLLNAIEPGSYVQPHRHLDPCKDETMIVLQGRLGVLLFSAEGEVLTSATLAAGGGNFGIDIPHGLYHTVLALAPGTVFFEAKAGPYRPLAAEEKANWAPAEGSVDCADRLASWTRRYFQPVN